MELPAPPRRRLHRVMSVVSLIALAGAIGTFSVRPSWGSATTMFLMGGLLLEMVSLTRHEQGRGGRWLPQIASGLLVLAMVSMVLDIVQLSKNQRAARAAREASRS